MGKGAIPVLLSFFLLGTTRASGAVLHTVGRALGDQVRRAEAPSDQPKEADLTLGWHVHSKGTLADIQRADGSREQLEIIGGTLFRRAQKPDHSWGDWTRLDRFPAYEKEAKVLGTRVVGDDSRFFVAKNADGHRERFQLEDSTLMHQWENADGTWTSWRPIGNRKLTEFVVAQNEKKQLQIFGIGQDGSGVWTIHQSSQPGGDEGGWSRWEGLGEPGSHQVSYGVYPDGHLQVQVTRSDGSLMGRNLGKALLDFSPDWGYLRVGKPESADKIIALDGPQRADESLYEYEKRKQDLESLEHSAPVTHDFWKWFSSKSVSGLSETDGRGGQIRRDGDSRLEPIRRSNTGQGEPFEDLEIGD